MSDEEPSGPAFAVAFSVQPPPDGVEGQWIGIHWQTPFATYIIGMPITSAEELAANFGAQLTATIAQAKRQASGLVVAPPSALTVLKGNK